MAGHTLIDNRIFTKRAISLGRQSSRLKNDTCAKAYKSKSALGWLAIKGKWWMPRLEMAMKDAA